jgi:Protein of unknown function (DUF4035)
VRHLLREITSAEIVEWEALYRIDPWGEARADLRSAIIAWTFASAHSKKGHKPKIESFMPNYEKAWLASERQRTGRQDDRTFASNLIAWHKALGGAGEVPTELYEIAGGKR